MYLLPLDLVILYFKFYCGRLLGTDVKFSLAPFGTIQITLRAHCVISCSSGKTTKVNCAQSSTIKSNNFQLALFGLIGPKNQFGCFDRQKYDGP
jgi:hypothetical protein